MKKVIIPILILVVIAVAAVILLLPKELPLNPGEHPQVDLQAAQPPEVSERPTPIPSPTPTPEPTATPVPTPAPTDRPTPTPVPSLTPALEPEIDTSQTDQAVLVVRYQSDNGKKIKVRLARGGRTYTYNLIPNNLPTRYPLNLGPGEYSVEVLENISGTSYRSMMKQTFTAQWEDEYTPYLQSVQNVRWEPSMEPVIDAIEMAVQAGDAGQVQAIYKELAETLMYDYEVYEKQSLPAGYLPDIEHTYATRLGICYDMSSLLAGMLRSTGVPAKLMMGYSDLIQGYHAWNEVLVDDAWVVVDLTVDSIYRESGMEYTFDKPAGQYNSDKTY